jgi:hypothetical protein
VALVSTSNLLESEVGANESWGKRGGGSITEGAGDPLADTTGSGSASVDPSAEEVSIVMCSVGGADFRMV